MSVTPPIGASGIYRLKAPFSSLLRPNVSYRCVSIRRFNDIAEQGVDPYEEYYKPYGLTEQKYIADAQAKEAIVSLVTDADHWVYVPTSYIESYPNQGGFPYQGLVLGVPLGPVPTYMDLTAVRLAIIDIVRDMLGIAVNPSYVAVTELEYLNQSDHDRLEAARAKAMAEPGTDRQRYLQMKALNDELVLQNARLEEFIRTNMT